MNSKSSASSDNNRWICPNDRVLTFRAKLDSGWSVRSTGGKSLQRSLTPSPCVSPYASASNLSIASSSSYADVGAALESSSGSTAGNQVTSNISEAEQEKILRVISRAKVVEQMEKERIQRLTERLHNMKRNSAGNGRDHCALCDEKLKFFSLTAASFDCQQCAKLVCNKCVVDQINPQTNTTSFYCKICSETREIWKKSGAWFLKSLPTFPLIASSPPAISVLPSPSTSSTASSSGHPTQYFMRSESPPSPTISLNSLESSITLSRFSVNITSPTPSGEAVPTTRLFQPPSSLPASPSARHKLSLHFNHKPRMK